MRKVLIANRGEIAIRVMRTCGELGLQTVAVAPQDDIDCLHVSYADDVVWLPGSGPSSYLDVDTVVAAAVAVGADSVHPGYGLLSESPEFAIACREAGLIFVGPSSQVLRLAGSKTSGREAARRAGIPVAQATGEVGVAEAEEFFASLGPAAAIMLKAVHGGGGNGMRPVTKVTDLGEAFSRCQSEAQRAFGSGALFAEELVRDARHIEVQIAGDGTDVTHLWERDCSLQRRRQKVVEWAPSVALAPERRTSLLDAAVRLGGEVGLDNLATVEFLVQDDRFVFIEVNPRLQVEHTVTEAITGFDLVRLQLDLASGRGLNELNLSVPPTPRGRAIQLRVVTETLTDNGDTQPTSGTLGAVQLPSGPRVRVDSHAYAGYTPNPRFDSLIAKVVLHSPSEPWDDLQRMTVRALEETSLPGLETNLDVLHAVVSSETFATGTVYTDFLERALTDHALTMGPRPSRLPTDTQAETSSTKVDLDVPAEQPGQPIRTSTTGVVVEVSVQTGDHVAVGDPLYVLESMKMQHAVTARESGVVTHIDLLPGHMLTADSIALWIETSVEDMARTKERVDIDPDHVRADLAEVLRRRSLGGDAQRQESVDRHHAIGHQTARENVEALVDQGSLMEIGSLALAAQSHRRSQVWLEENTTGDGVITGIGRVDGELLGPQRSETAVLAYDYPVFAGTQGNRSHKKIDRLIHLAKQRRLPLVMFTEGGGGRPGDDWDLPVLARMTFQYLAELSGEVPLVAVNAGRCFAGNAALLGMCDVVIATRDSNLGMGGPALIEGGGLGRVDASAIGPAQEQFELGVIDVLVDDESEAIAAAKRYLAYFRGPIDTWDAPDQRRLRHVIPENRLRSYDVREVIHGLADLDSVMEIKEGFGRAVVVAFARIEGQPVGVVANNPMHAGGAIQADAADKAVDFLKLCEAHQIPVLSLIDTPGFMVGIESEREGSVRRLSKLVREAGRLTTPFAMVVLRKSYGLGAMAMIGPGLEHARAALAWPTAEFGPMGLEGLVTLGYRRELDAIADPDVRKARFDELVQAEYAKGDVLIAASKVYVDDVIDPADTRHAIASALS